MNTRAPACIRSPASGFAYVEPGRGGTTIALRTGSGALVRLPIVGAPPARVLVPKGARVLVHHQQAVVIGDTLAVWGDHPEGGIVRPLPQTVTPLVPVAPVVPVPPARTPDQPANRGADNDRRLTAEPYAAIPVHELEDLAPEKMWLVEHLWQRQGAGIVGGGAKGAKTWLTVETAVAIATNTPVLGVFPVHQSGPVLMYCAEGGQGYIRARMEGALQHRGMTIDTLPHPIHYITERVRLDEREQQDRLWAAVHKFRPVLLVLDPLVRLHRGDENLVASISPLLGFLSEIQTDFSVSVMVVHHTRKRTGGEVSGEDIRGSGDLYAWGDSNILVKKRGNLFAVVAEHRAAASPEPWAMRALEKPILRLEYVNKDEAPEDDDRKLKVLESIRQLGAASRDDLTGKGLGRTSVIGEILKELAAEGRIEKRGGKWVEAKAEVDE